MAERMIRRRAAAPVSAVPGYRMNNSVTVIDRWGATESLKPMKLALVPAFLFHRKVRPMKQNALRGCTLARRGISRKRPHSARECAKGTFFIQ